MKGPAFAELLVVSWQGAKLPDGATDYVYVAFTERLARRIPAETIQAWKADPVTHRAGIDRAVMRILSEDPIARDLVRRLDQRPTPPHEEKRLKSDPVIILFIAANPPDQIRLNIEREIKGIDYALQTAIFRDRFKLHNHGAVRPTELHGYLQRYKPDILHFSGHGGGEEGLHFQGPSWSSSLPVAGPALANALTLLRPKLRCVLLNACHTEEQARVIAASKVPGTCSARNAARWTIAVVTPTGGGDGIDARSPAVTV